MYGGYVESDFVKQNCRLWQVILPFECVNITTNIVKWPGRSNNTNNGKEYFMQLFTQNPG
jgi:hypothetical protein